MRTHLPFDMEEAYKMRIAEYVLEGEIGKARCLAEVFAQVRDRFPTATERLAVFA